jgi:hypothetical protein
VNSDIDGLSSNLIPLGRERWAVRLKDTIKEYDHDK